MSERIKVLIIEDVPADAELAAAVLGRRWRALEWERVETEAAFLAALAGNPDIVIADFEVPGFGALPALELMQRLKTRIPALVFTGSVTEQVVAQCMALGAADCLLKDHWAQLVQTVSDILERFGEPVRVSAPAG